MKILLNLTAIISMMFFVSFVSAEQFKPTKVIDKKSYIKTISSNGVVLISVNWGRKWSCSGFEHAQLVNINFVKFNNENLSFGSTPELSINTPSRVFVNNEFNNLAFSLSEGEYALYSFKIKVAQSIKEVGYLGYGPSNLIKEQKSLGGTFTVHKGEVVYVGHFSLDCGSDPTLWRFYPDGVDAFNQQLTSYKKSFPFIDFESAVFRLFKTSEFGHDYDLPKLSE